MAVATQSKTKPNVVLYGQGQPTYGYGFDDRLKNRTQLEIELLLGMWKNGSLYLHNGQRNPKGRPRWEHVKNAIDLIWNRPDTKTPFIWHPWAYEMIQAMCAHDMLSFAGCAGSGKSVIMAVWAIISFLAAPRKTRVLVTSSSLKDARGRIWGYVEHFWQGLPLPGPGKLVSSQGTIRYCNPVDGSDQSDIFGITLVAGDQSAEKDSIGKLIGFHAPRVILMADELPTLSMKLVDAALSNLSANPYSAFIAAGNPRSHYDPHGVFSEPLNGWETVSDADYSWQGKRAFVVRLDGHKSPNLGPEGVKYPFLITPEQLDNFKRLLGEKSARYAEQVRGTWHNATGEDTIYSPVELASYKCHRGVVWQGPTTTICGCDPAFTHGGDRCVATFCKVGTSVEGIRTVERYKTVPIYEDTTNKGVSRTEQIVTQLIDLCKQEGVDIRNLAVDATGAGDPFCDFIQTKWGTGFLRVKFGNSASEHPVSATDPTPAKEMYADRACEIWMGGKSLMLGNQLRGIDNDLAKEMTTRTTKMVGRKLRLTPKEEMRKELGFSPDNADSYFLALAIARERHKFSAESRPANWKAGKERPMTKKFRALQDVYAA